MKVGIISEFNIHTVNYGNHLQAYALNRFIREHFSLGVQSIYFSNPIEMFFTVKEPQGTSNKMKEQLKQIRDKSIRGWNKLNRIRVKKLLEERYTAFQIFAKNNIPMSKEPMNWEKLLASNYDCFVVGSDVVWAQSEQGINRIKFLDFDNQSHAKKISYAASFGRNYIPGQNRDILKKILDTYEGVSVREKSSVSMLEELGLNHPVHSLDPVLLLERREWEELVQDVHIQTESGKYAFVYMLGWDRKQRKEIASFCRKNGLKVVSVPYANGHYVRGDIKYADINVINCSPEEWICWIKKAELVITDSFHAMVFATIFERPFFVMRRISEQDINLRLADFLEFIGETDKSCSDLQHIEWQNVKWDYETIKKVICKKKEESIAYLKEHLQ